MATKIHRTEGIVLKPSKSKCTYSTWTSVTKL